MGGKMDNKLISVLFIFILVCLLCGTTSAANVADSNTILSNANSKDLNNPIKSLSPDNTVQISGTVYKCNTPEPFSGATITITDPNNQITAKKTTIKDGKYNAQFLSAYTTFRVTASYPGHHPTTKTVNVNNKFTGTADFALGTINWTDYTINPIYNPGSRAGYPGVIYDSSSFGVSGGPKYKMWFDNGSNIYLTTSSNGITWNTPLINAGLYGTSAHPKVIYDASSFGTPGGATYKMIYWDGGMSYTLNNMRYAESSDGINWSQDQVLTQDPAHQLIVNDPSHASWNSGTYGPNQIFYQAGKLNTGPNPWNYSYVMYYDGTTGGKESIGLAYSSDALYWIGYSALPVIDHGIAGDWDSDFATFGTLYREPGSSGIYHFWYSGGQTASNQGIGHATSNDGLTWIKDTNPIYHIDPNTPPAPVYRAGRVYTPFVVDDGSGNLKMYYTGSPTSSSGMRICLATAPAPQSLTVTDVDPTNGATNVALNKTVTITFNTIIQPGSAYNNITITRNLTGITKPISKSIIGNQLFLYPLDKWNAEEGFSINLPINAVQDLGGSGLATSFTSQFFTTHPPVRDTRTNLYYYHIQDAISDPLTLNGDTIEVSPGIYNENILINKSLHLIGQNRDTTIIDGRSLGTVLTLANGLTITLYNFTITHGYASLGGGIYNPGQLTVENCIFKQNKGAVGGGIANCGDLILRNSILKYNHATNNGGGIHNAGATAIENCQIIFNNALNGAGIFNSGLLSITNSNISGNNADYGGAIFSAIGNVTLDNVSLDQNTAAGKGGAIFNSGNIIVKNNSIFRNNVALQEGGAIYNITGNLNITNSTLNNNKSSGNAGAVYNLGYTQISNTNLIENIGQTGGALYNDVCTFNANNINLIGNTASLGAAIFNLGDFSLDISNVSSNPGKNGAIYNKGTMNINNVQLIKNKSSAEGGAIYNTGYINLTNSNVNENVASYGAGIYTLGSTIQIYNTQFVGNSAMNGAAIWNGATINITGSIINSNVAQGTGAAVQNHGTLNIDSTHLNKNQANKGAAIYNTGFTTILNYSQINDNVADFGGAIYTTNSTVNIYNTQISSNAAVDGGAIYNGAAVNLDHCTLTYNKAQRYGGAIRNLGYLTLTNDSYLANNSAQEGGAIYTNLFMQMNDSIITHNNADYGGGIYNTNTTKVVRSVMTENTAACGGAVFNSYYTLVKDSNIYGNFSPNMAGVYNTDGAILDNENSIIIQE
jgi:hypothetical protein